MLQSAFDKYAGSYDHSFSNTRVGRLQRAAVHRVLLASLKSRSRILEVNAGTGEDAIWLASLGHQVLATDISPAMVHLIREKASLQSGISTRVMDLTAIGEEAAHSADLVFSDFGGLNCVDPGGLKQFLAGANHVLVPGGLLFLVVMGRKCIWERWYFRFRPKRGDKNRRKSKCGVQTIIHGEQFNTWYYSPMQLASLADGKFSRVFTFPVGFFVPPSYLEPLVNRIPGLISVLGWLDRMTASWSSASDYADHYIIGLRKVADE